MESCSGYVVAVHQRLLSMQVELCELLPKKKGGGGGEEGGAAAGLGRSTSLAGHSSSAYGGPSSSSSSSSSRLSGPSSSASASSSAHRDIARLFSVKVPTYAPVRMNRVDPLVAVVRIALQCLIECTRMRHLPKDSSAAQLIVQQTEADMYALQQLLPQPLQAEQGGGGEEGRVIFAQMEEVRHSMLERGDDSLDVQPLSLTLLDQLLHKTTQQQQQQQQEAHAN